DKRETLKSRMSELVIFEDGLKRTALLPMIESYLGKPRCIEGDSSLSSSGLQELFFGDEQELRLRVNEPSNQPGAGHAIYFHVLSCYPFHSSATLPFFSIRENHFPGDFESDELCFAVTCVPGRNSSVPRNAT